MCRVLLAHALGPPAEPSRRAARGPARRGSAAPRPHRVEPDTRRLHYPDDLLRAARGRRARASTSRSRSAGASAREAAAADFARRGYPVPAERVFLTASTSEAYAFLFKLLADPGDEVLVPRPGYPLFEFLAGARVGGGAPATRSPTTASGTSTCARCARRSSPRTRAIVVVNPNNPTGVFLKRDERRALEQLCAERSLALVSDEVFADFAFANDARRAGSVADDGPALAFALGGLSKSCGLPQLKLAWTAVSGPRRLVEEALARLEVIADSYLSVSTPVQVALPALLARRDELQAPIQQRTARQPRRACVRAPRARRRRCSSPRAAGTRCCASRRRSARTSA